ncbi:MAG: NUDIX hydrolase [Planctomycetota bacterium]|jgi:ADP-ribose pyrophosphatase
MHRKTLLSTRLFTVENREYPFGEGGTLSRDVIVHPGAVVVVPQLDDGRLVMIRNYRHAVEQQLLELPAGTREPGEESIGTAMRELVEETGYRAATMEPLVSFFSSPGICTECMECFTASDLAHVGQDLEAGEQIEVELVDPSRLQEMLRGGELHDGKTIAALATFFARRSGLS